MIDGNGLDPGDPSLYHGLAGVTLALHEAYKHFGDDRYRQAVERGADALSALADDLDGCSLYFGLAGVAIALRALGRDTAADGAMNRVRHRFDGRHRPGRTTSLTELSASCTRWLRSALPPNVKTWSRWHWLGRRTW